MPRLPSDPDDSAWLHAVAAHGLPGADASPRHATTERWPRLRAAVVAHRLEGLLVRAIDDGAIVLDLDDEADARALHQAITIHTMRIEALLAETQAALAAEGVDLRVLKGPAVAHLDHPDPSVRTYGDLDLLVRGTDLERAATVFERLGFHRGAPELRPGFDRRFAKGIDFHRADSPSIDVHRTLVHEPFGLLIDLDDLWRSAVPFTVAGTAVTALDAENRFLHACYHAVLGNRPPRLNSVRDVALFLTSPTLDADVVLARARRWHAEVIVADAARLVDTHLTTPPDSALTTWARSFRATDRARAMVTSFDGGDARQGRRTLATVRVLPVRDRLPYLRAIAIPSRSFAAEHGGRRAWLTRGLRGLVRRTRRDRGQARPANSR